MQALRIIYDEHRGLAAVLHGMLYLVHEIRDRRGKPNFELLGAMIYYIDAFPERFHHPKEEEYLFRLLRLRHPGAAPLLDRLTTEHRGGTEKIRTLEQALARYQQGGDREFSKFLAAVESYAAFHWDHMRAEETEVLPLAEKYLLGQRLGRDRRCVSRSRRSVAWRGGGSQVRRAVHPHRQLGTAAHRPRA
jgi:hemerythrin-like domain-containing protein